MAISLFEAEDEAIKAHLQGITVADEANDSRPVGVWFENPAEEFAASRFPFITVAHVDTDFDETRAHSYNWDYQDYLPSELPPSEELGEVYAPFPIPVLLNYVVTCYTRHPRHDRQLVRMLNLTRLNPRFAALGVPADGSVRRIEVKSQNGVRQDYMDANRKTVFRKSWAISIPAEIPTEVPIPAADFADVAEIVLSISNIG